MSDDLSQLRRTMPDLARVDPLSAEVCGWLDRAYDAVRRVDQAEGVIIRMQQRYLLDPVCKIVARNEIADSVDRAMRTAATLQRWEIA